MLQLRPTFAVVLAGLALALPSLAGADPIPQSDRRSGFDMMSPEAQAMQRDDFANPAMLSVRAGEALWRASPAEGKPSCASCHGEADTAMKGVAATYPQVDASGRALALSDRIRLCQSERQGVAPGPHESETLLALEALVALQSRGMPLSPRPDAASRALGGEGRALFGQRIGQLNLSCAQCHDESWGKRLGGSIIPQGHPTGYPIYRLEWQSVGSLRRRIRNCMTGVRAEPFAPDSREMLALQRYLAERASGMPIDAPAVRP